MSAVTDRSKIQVLPADDRNYDHVLQSPSYISDQSHFTYRLESCPQCGSLNDIERNEAAIKIRKLYIECECLFCGQRWTERACPE